MKNRHRATAARLTILAALGAAPGQAQPAGMGSLDAVPLRQNVWVTSVDGVEVRGRVAEKRADALVLRVDAGDVIVPVGRIRRIETRDSYRNGTLIGLAVGAAGMFVFGYGVADSTEGQAFEWKWGGIFALIGGAGGAAAGAGIDAAVEGRRVIYAATNGLSLGLSPVSTLRGAGLSVTVRW